VTLDNDFAVKRSVTPTPTNWMLVSNIRRSSRSLVHKVTR